MIYEKVSEIHVSGHAFRDELKEMINLTMPDYFIPIHGEYRHLYHHAQLAKEAGIPGENVLLAKNGQVIELDENGGRIGRPSPPAGVWWTAKAWGTWDAWC
ncbi:MAG: MBL fold metallo-hydrolase RNA specificity domain-containing protein [Desulfobacterales bacterium]